MDEIEASMQFGLRVQQFLKTDVGQYLVGRARIEADEAVEKLKTCPSWRPKLVQKYQNQIMVAEWFEHWLAGAVQDGLNAKHIIEGFE